MTKDEIELMQDSIIQASNKVELLQKIVIEKAVELERLKEDAHNLITKQEQEIAQLKAENVRLTTKLGQVLLSIDTVKEMNTMCSIDEQRKQAKIDVLNELKKKKSIAIWDIDEMIEELKK